VCSELYGTGRCASDLDPEVAAATTAVKALFDLLARCDLNTDDVEALRLYWLLPPDRRRCKQGFLLLLVASKLGKGQQQAVFAEWTRADAADDGAELVTPGRLLKLCRGSTPETARPFVDDVSLACRLAHISPEWTVRRVAYVPQEGSFLKVVSCREIDVEALRAAEREAQEAEAAVRLVKRAEADARNAGEAGRGGAACGRGRQRRRSHKADPAAGAPARKAGKAAAMRAESAAGQAGEGAGEQDDGDVGPEEVDAALEEAPLPRRDPGTGRVFDANNKYLGAIRIAKPGEPGSFVSVYCSAHKCSKVYRAHRQPSTLGLLQWFCRGTCNSRPLTQSEHLRLIDSFAFGEA